VTRVATGNVFHAANAVLLYQRCAQVELIVVPLPIYLDGIQACRLLVTHIEYLLARTQILFRSAMAIQAPFHLQRLLLVHQRHLVDWAVAGVASHSFIDVNAVVEINEVRKLVHPRPLQRLSGAVAGADWLEQLGVGPDLRVAVHAGLGRRNASEARSFDCGVAVAAVDAESGNVMLVAEGYGLWLAHSGVGNVGRTLHFQRRPAEHSNDEHRAKDGGARQSVRAAMKDLRHACVRA